MNEKPFGLPLTFGEALDRLSKVPKSAIQKKTPGKPKAHRARRAKRSLG